MAQNPSTGDYDISSQEARKVIFISSLGTVFEWYDFYLYILMTGIFSKQFFTGFNATTATIFALLVFAAGFMVRPLGALLFGRLGDSMGRKNTFVITMALMGISTAAVGLLPNTAQIGIAAPALLVFLRLVQGLALGGQYGGAAIYVAEHAPANKRGYFTGWIQTTATLGLFAAFFTVTLLQKTMAPAGFDSYGWRIPYLLSIILFGVSMFLRMRLNESPVYAAMKSGGGTSKAPLTEAFGRRENLVLLGAAFCVVMGQAVLWYTGQIYAWTFLTKMLHVDGVSANMMAATALILVTPGFVYFGWLSDKVGRKPIMLAGLALATLTYYPAFQLLSNVGNPALAKAQASAPITMIANQSNCSLQFDITGTNKFNTNSCDIAKKYLADNGLSYNNTNAAGEASIKIADTVIAAPVPSSFATPELKEAGIKAFNGQVTAALKAAGYPLVDNPAAAKDPKAPKLKYTADTQWVSVIAILAYLTFLATMIYGPIAATLVEIFPSRIRYTSLSFPYHLANGWIGGLLPATAVGIVSVWGNIFSGLMYPIGFAALSLVLSFFFLPETKDYDINR
jgi:MFS family permease